MRICRRFLAPFGGVVLLVALALPMAAFAQESRAGISFEGEQPAPDKLHNPPVFYVSTGLVWQSSKQSPIIDDFDFRSKHPRWGVVFIGPGWLDACNRYYPTQAAGPLAAGETPEPLHCGVGYKGNYHYISRVWQDYSEMAIFTPNLVQSGLYEVWVAWINTDNRATDARFRVNFHGGKRFFSLNELQGSALYGQQETWALFGTFPFLAGNKSGSVILRNNPNSHSEGIDAVGFRFVEPLGPYVITGAVTSGGSPVAGATIAAGDATIASVVTGADGIYEMRGVPYWWSGTLTASKDGLSFSPSAVVNVASGLTVNFTAVP